MLVPRSYQYASSPPQYMDGAGEKSERRNVRKSSASIRPSESTARPRPINSSASKRTPTEPVTIPSSKPNHAAQQQRRQPSVDGAQALPATFKGASVGRRHRKSSAHDPRALSPSVAALLAVTSIPPRRPNRYRSRPGADRRISIEELVSEWKSDDSLKSSYGTSPVLSALLEDIDDGEEHTSRSNGAADMGFLKTRSASSESVPSLEADDRSILSAGSPSTPGSLRSRRSLSNLKKPRPIESLEACALDHPLVALPESDDDDEGFQLSTQKRQPQPAKARSSFKSNLTASLQNLKNAAISSFTSLGRANSAPSAPNHPAAPAIDEMLWSHPFLFPRFSSEIRPAIDGHASEAQRRYLNPPPLTFEEQEAPFQQALHAPYLAAGLSADAHATAPTIQMQTYNRSGGGRRSRSGASSRRASSNSSSSNNGPDPNSEAGRALLGAAGVRQREIRENSDFLRVVVLEMNMRRGGKLESGRARIWLPPREESGSAVPSGRVDGHHSRVPSRWVGVSAY